MPEAESQELDSGLATVLAVELFYREKPELDKRTLLKQLRTRLPDIQPLDGKDDSELMAFLHPKHLVTYKDGNKLPAQCLVAAADKAPEFSRYTDAIQQSWSFPKCEETVKACKHTMVVTDFVASGLPYKQRFQLLREVLISAVKAAPPDAIYWQFSQHFTRPEEFLQDATESGEMAGVQSAMNVRFFNITNNEEGDMIMDTLGLGALGLHDFQCHFRNLDPQHVAMKLYNIGLYTYEKGAVIESGQTIEGLKPGEKWHCQFEASLLKPTREIMDVNPGKPNAAGNRH